MSYENILEGLIEFLTKDSKLGTCDDKSIQYLDSMSNPFLEWEDDTSRISSSFLIIVPHGQHLRI